MPTIKDKSQSINAKPGDEARDSIGNAEARQTAIAGATKATKGNAGLSEGTKARKALK